MTSLVRASVTFCVEFGQIDICCFRDMTIALTVSLKQVFFNSLLILSMQ